MNQNTKDKEYWGDDELTAEDVSGTMLLQWADLTAFFNQKGYSGTYPALIYFSEEAEKLSDMIFNELSHSQSPSQDPRFVINVYTKFKGEEEATHGDVSVVFSGVKALYQDVSEDILFLMLDGIKHWLEGAYSTHGKKARLDWQTKGTSEAHGVITATEQ